MDKLLERLVDSIEVAHTTIHELQQARANDPRFIHFNRSLWIVRHSMNAARAAIVDVSSELSKLRDKGVEL